MKTNYLQMKKLTLSIMAFFAFYLLSAQGKPYEKNYSSYKNYMLSNYGVAVNIPPNFIDMNNYFVIWSVNKVTPSAGNVYGPFLMSKDKECFVMYPALESPNQIQFELMSSIGNPYLRKDDSIINIYDYTTEIKGKKAHDMFNADSYFIYDIPRGDSVCIVNESLEKLRSSKYPYCTGLNIIKERRNSFCLKFFFTKKGKENQEKYIYLLSKQIWFENNFKTKTEK